MPDWTDQVADAIEKTVAAVRDRTVAPADRIVRMVVAGLVVALLAAAALVLAVIAVFRVIEIYVPGHVWATYLIAGGLFTVAGLLLWPRRRS